MKILCLILSIMMILGSLPLTALAKVRPQPGSVENNIAYSIPANRKNPVLEFNILKPGTTKPVKVFTGNCVWSENNKVMKENDTFKGGHTYEITLALDKTVLEKYFPGEYVKINGKIVSRTAFKKLPNKTTVYYQTSVVCPVAAAGNVEIKNRYPSAGDKGDFKDEVIYNSRNCRLKSAEWINYVGGNKAIEIEDNHSYHGVYTLAADDGFKFTEDTKAFVNGAEADIIKNSGKEITVKTEKIYVNSKEIRNLVINDFPINAGAFNTAKINRVKNSVNSPRYECYNVFVFEEGTKNSVKTLEAGKTYDGVISLEVKEDYRNKGYRFTEPNLAVVNYDTYITPENISNNSTGEDTGRYRTIKFSFTAIDEVSYIGYINIECDKYPLAGNDSSINSWNSERSEKKKYDIIDMFWAEKDNYTPAAELIEGKEYVAIAKLKEKPGYRFEDLYHQNYFINGIEGVAVCFQDEPEIYYLDGPVETCIDGKITSFEINGLIPYPGKTVKAVNDTFSIVSDKVKAESITWMHGKNFSAMNDSDTFTKNESYSVAIKFAALDNCKFISPVAVTFNGKTEDRTTGILEDGKVFSATFDSIKSESIKISELNFDNFPIPQAGKNPSELPEYDASEQHIVIDEIRWINKDNVQQTDAFENGKEYRVRMFITPEENYEADGSTVISFFGKPATLKVNNGLTYIDSAAVLAKSTGIPLSSVEINVNNKGILKSEPVSGGGYFAESDFSCSRNEIILYDVFWANSETPTEYAGYLCSGDTYTLTAKVKPQDEYIINKNTTLKINGVEYTEFINVPDHADGNIYFICGPEITMIGEINISMNDEFWPGMKIDYAGTGFDLKILDNPATAKINGIRWYEDGENISDTPVNEFKPLTNYIAKFYLTPENGYAIKDDTEIIINEDSCNFADETDIITERPTGTIIADTVGGNLTSYPCAPFTRVDITKVSSPEHGNTPYTKTTCIKTNPSAVKLEENAKWFDEKGNNAVGKFESGKKYTLRLSFAKNDAYHMMPNDCKFEVIGQNGEKAANVKYTVAADEKYIDCTFVCTDKEIGEVTVENLPTPLEGKVTYPKLTIGNAEFVSAKWTDSKGNAVSELKAGQKYNFTLTVKAGTGEKFGATDISPDKFNDKKSTVDIKEKQLTVTWKDITCERVPDSSELKNLKALIDKASAIKNLADYTEETANALTDALYYAKAAYEDKTAGKETIAKVTKNLQNAINGLKLKPAVPAKITSSVYKTEGGLLQGIIAPANKAADILKNINEKADCKLFDKDGKEITGDALVGTGAEIRLYKDGKVADKLIIVVNGDIDGDGKVTAADARSALRNSVQLDKLNAPQTAAANTDTDKKITAADARFILRVSVGLDSFK